MIKSKQCILLHQIGPYHHARLNALAKDFDVLAIEIRASSNEYYWTGLDHGECNYTAVRAQGKSGIYEVFEQNGIDFFLIYGWSEAEYLHTVLYAKKNGKKVFMASDSTDIGNTRNFIKHFIKRKIAESIDGFLVAGTLSEDYIRYYVPHAHLAKPFDVVDNAHFANTLPLRTDGYLLCVARLIEKKNIRCLLEAFASMRTFIAETNTRLLIVGSGPERDNLNALIQSNNLSDAVRIEEWKSYNELPEVYHHAQALILPSLYDETWGLVVNEAMAAGLPVLLSKNCGCVPDLVQEGVNGFTFEPSAAGVENALRRFMQLDSSAKEKMGVRSCEIIDGYALNKHTQAMMFLNNAGKASSIGSMSKSVIHIILLAHAIRTFAH